METSVTDFAPSPTETYKTGKTYSVGNRDFLETVFGDLTGDARPVVVSFKGDPTKVPSKAWAGRAWPCAGVIEGGSAEVDGAGKSSFLPADANNYFSLAVFDADGEGEYRRLKATFKALHAIMLDDIGTKVPLERLTLRPSWLIETSSGNYQAGYILREPITDGHIADRLVEAIVDSGLCDPGANGPRTRLARLPVGVNGKHSPPFQCVLKEWNPELKYSVEELVAGLQVDMKSPGRSRREAFHDHGDRPSDGDPVFIPGPTENAVLAALRDRGLYKSPLGEGKHDITCPWVSEHTGQVDGGTAYFEPDDSWPIGGFKCLHGHCAKRHIRDLLRHLEVQVHAARMKPTLRVMAGEIHRVADAAERELSLSGRYYQRGGLVVTVVTDPGTRETRVQEVSQPALLRALSSVARWERFDSRSTAWVQTDPPARHVSVLFDATAYAHLPVLNGLARQPYLRDDGTLMTLADYDSATGMFGVFVARQFYIPVSPTRENAEAALAVLVDLLAEFRFGKDSDMSAALAAILTAVARPSLPLAPMFHVKAHMVGSGKSYLCELITAFATPQRGTPTTFPADDEECRKLILAELLRAPAVIEFDNLTGDLIPHKSLCTALTSEHLTGRILGVSKTATVKTRTLFISSGNNVGPVQDMARRCVTIHLDPGCEVPAARTFQRPELVREVLADRGKYVSAVLTIVRAWVVAGRPRLECKAFAGFGDWADYCRQPLLWLGLADPTDSVFEAMADDPDRETLGRLLVSWQTVFGKNPGMVRDAIRKAAKRNEVYQDEYGELYEVLHDIADERGEVNRRKLGWWIRRHAGRIVNGLKFVRASGNRSAEAWQVEEV